MDLDTIVRSYDIRGTYPDQINEDAVYALARSAAAYLEARTLVLGRDARTSSPALHEAAIKGVRDNGTDVYELGECTTPMLYYASCEFDVDGAIMITASHNPPAYNGMKVTKQNAELIGYTTGLKDIKEIAQNDSATTPSKTGTSSDITIREAWYEEMNRYAAFYDTEIRAVIDTANMMGALELPVYRRLEPTLRLQTLYEDIDGSMPNHEANPLQPETLEDLSGAVKHNGAHLGIAYDGDADRVGFVDENGAFIHPHLITALLARSVLAEHPDATIAYDVPSSRSVKEEIEKHGGTPLMTKVGTVHIKQAMRDAEAVFGGEFSGHYYFEDYHYAEAPTRVALMLMALMAHEDAPLSQLIDSVSHYEHSGEITVDLDPHTDKVTLLESFKEAYNDGELTEIDGVRVDYDDWWFLVRPSNTEPKMRLMIEARNTQQLARRKEELTKLLQDSLS